MRPLVTIVMMAAFLAGCSRNQSADTPDAPRAGVSAVFTEPVDPIADGRTLFRANCTGCHGKNADGNTPAGKAWRVPDLHSPQVQSISDPQLGEIIRRGKGKMPAWGGLLSRIDIEHVLAYVRSLPQK